MEKSSLSSNRNNTSAVYLLTAWNFPAEIIPGTEGATKPKWSPDKGRIAVSQLGDILTMNPDGSNIVNLTNSPDFTETEPAWSHDGQFIAYTSNQEGGWQIYTIPAGGGDPTKLTDTGDNIQPCWYRSGGCVYRFRSDCFYIQPGWKPGNIPDANGWQRSTKYYQSSSQ